MYFFIDRSSSKNFIVSHSFANKIVFISAFYLEPHRDGDREIE
ncbi:MAG: hypothetical protein K0S36_210 [Nitrosospira multiformis]|jgi:hypothetical protein|nr:hypothetical protein [Nitrosospira multiformis]